MYNLCTIYHKRPTILFPLKRSGCLLLQKKTNPCNFPVHTVQLQVLFLDILVTNLFELAVVMVSKVNCMETRQKEIASQYHRLKEY